MRAILATLALALFVAAASAAEPFEKVWCLRYASAQGAPL